MPQSGRLSSDVHGHATNGSRLFRGLSIASVATIALQFAWIHFHFGGEYATTAFTDILGIPAAFAGTAACIWASRSAQTRARRAWVALGAATASWGIGEAIWTYYEVVLRKDAPFPGLADIGFLGLVPLAVIALLAFPTAPHGAAARMRAILDGLIIAGSVLFIAWATFLGPAFAASEGGLLLQIAGLAYPIGDVVVIAIVLYVLARSGQKDRLALGLVALGLLSISMADAGFTWLSLAGLYDAGSLIDPLWNAGFLLIALGAIRRPRFSHDVRDERFIGPLAIAAPYAPFVIATGVAMVVQIVRGALGPFLFWDSVAVIFCLIVRQILALADNLSLNRELEKRVADRTNELEDALGELEESKRLQDEFVANATHELLTPLTVIMSALEVMRMENQRETDDEIDTIEIARGASVRMKRLVENVLLASGVVSKIDCESQPFDVDVELRAAINSVPTDKTIQLDAPYPLKAKGDAERFRMVIEHVLRNADKFAPPKSKVRIDAYRERGQVHVTIADEGPGIPEDQREAVFHRFFQVDGSSTRRHGGIGLGLFLARHLAIAMGGSLDVDETAIGARLHFTVVALEEESSAQPGQKMIYVPVKPESRGVA
jgi:signal transduction histidine kinase